MIQPNFGRVLDFILSVLRREVYVPVDSTTFMVNNYCHLLFLHSEEFPKFTPFPGSSNMETKVLIQKQKLCKQQWLESFKNSSTHPKNKPK